MSGGLVWLGWSRGAVGTAAGNGWRRFVGKLFCFDRFRLDIRSKNINIITGFTTSKNINKPCLSRFIYLLYKEHKCDIVKYFSA